MLQLRMQVLVNFYALIYDGKSCCYVIARIVHDDVIFTHDTDEQKDNVLHSNHLSFELFLVIKLSN